MKRAFILFLLVCASSLVVVPVSAYTLPFWYSHHEYHFYETAGEALATCRDAAGAHCGSWYSSVPEMNCKDDEVSAHGFESYEADRNDGTAARDFYFQVYLACKKGCPDGTTFNVDKGKCEGGYYVEAEVKPDIDIGKNNGDSCSSGTPPVFDPINPATGNMFETVVDYAAVPKSSVQFVRYYNSSGATSPAGVLGAGWSSGYGRHLTPQYLQPLPPYTHSPNQSKLYGTKADACEKGWGEISGNVHSAPPGTVAEYDGSSCVLSVQGKRWGALAVHDNSSPSGQVPGDELVGWYVTRPDGKTFHFKKNLDGWQAATLNGWLSDPDVTATLETTSDGLRFTNVNGTVENYDTDGRLLSIVQLDGRTESMTYDDSGQLATVTGPFGRKLSFSYVDGKLATVTQPDGGLIKYDYDTNGNLVQVTHPDNSQTRYRYENTTYLHALTGVTDENGNLYSSWTYDRLGRAVANEHAGGADHGTLDYHDDGSVTVTHALGKQTTYHFETIQGVPRVVRIEGHPSSSCVGANRNFSYDENGFLLSKTDWKGNVTTYVRDAKGREISRTEAAGTPEARTITTEWHPIFNLPVKVVEPGKITLYQYDDKGHLISRTEQSNP